MIAHASDLDLGGEYSDYNKERYQGKSHPKVQKEDDNLVVKTLLFVPNRILDILDIIRVDVGVGPSAGAVVRITPYAQAGVRLMMPLSVRLGLRGRRSPVFVEHVNEMGIGPTFLSSNDREPSILEIGVGADLFLAGFYVGISLDSIGDAIVGFAGFDPAEDDL